MRVELIEYTPNPEGLVAAAAKLCYSDAPIEDLLRRCEGDNQRFIDMLASLGHESPFEHISFSFAVEGVSRSLLAQITRHRIASYSVQSQRYVKLDDFRYVVPPAISANAEASEEFEAAMQDDRMRYERLYDILRESGKKQLISEGLSESEAEKKAEKTALEDARYVFPNACETKFVMTINARSLFNFFAHRCCNRAQWEIHELADEMLHLVREKAPNIFKKSGPPCLRGGCPEGKMTCGKMDAVRKKYTEAQV